MNSLYDHMVHENKYSGLLSPNRPHKPMVNERSRRLARSTSYRGSVFKRLSQAEKKSKPQTLEKRERSAASWRDSSNLKSEPKL